MTLIKKKRWLFALQMILPLLPISEPAVLPPHPPSPLPHIALVARILLLYMLRHNKGDLNGICTWLVFVESLKCRCECVVIS